MDTPIRALDIDDTITLALDHTCVLLDTGAVRCWGNNISGQLGYGHTDVIGDDEHPISAGNVSVGGTVVQLAAGERHTCALLDTGAVRCWGYNFYGQLGYGHTNDIGDDELPSSAGNVNVGGTVVQLVAGELHTCALLDTGAVRCWGNANSGRLGYENLENIGDDELPSSAGNVNVGGTVTKLAAGGHHTCALLDTGAVRCWGHNAAGQLGYGHTAAIGDDEEPWEAGDVPVDDTVTQIDGGRFHTCALLDTGAVHCWGNNSYGQLGYGHTNKIGDNEPASDGGDVSVGGTVTHVAAADYHTCALLDTGGVRCWGSSPNAVLGYAFTNNQSIGDNELPSSAGDVNVGDPAIQLDTGRFHTCVLLDTGEVRCWGAGGLTGYSHTNTIGDNEHPASAGDVSYR